ncbi:hypothetical protein [Arthrobacter sp. N1]|uniref:hypothetical protein n=1 Tax=Arthrobacter sp. N1 TaxID=619291 RepID=UPI003BB1F190
MTTTQSRESKGRPTGGQFAATAHAESGISLEPRKRKVTSKGTEYVVTLPDGTTAKRTSARAYSHVVVASEERPELVIANRLRRNEEIRLQSEAIDRALANPVAKIKSRGFTPTSPDGDPDKDYRGEPSYHSHVATIRDPQTGEILEHTWANSKGICRGGYEEDGEFNVHKPSNARTYMLESLAKKRKANDEYIAANLKDIEAVKAGTYPLRGPGVLRWSSRPDLAQKAASGEFTYTGQTREITVQAIDEP